LVVTVADVFTRTAANFVATLLPSLGESARWFGVAVLSQVNMFAELVVSDPWLSGYSHTGNLHLLPAETCMKQ